MDEEIKIKDFTTLDVTIYTPEPRVKAMVKNPQRPGNVCKMSAGFVKEDELENMARVLDVTVDQLKNNLLEEVSVYHKQMHKPKLMKDEEKAHLPMGTCVFFDDEKTHCRLGEHKPLHCKLATTDSHGHKIHIWYLLNHVIDKDNPHAIREWSTYLKTHPTIPGGKLHELVKDRVKLDKILRHHDVRFF